jgi:hypothetical protein
MNGTDTGAIFNEAFRRALPQSVVLALGSFFVLLPQTDDWKILLSSCGVAFLGPLGFRGVGEYMYDSSRAKNGTVLPSDVPVASDKVTVSKVA